MKMQRQEDGGEGMSLLSGPCQGEIARNPALLLQAIRRVAEAGGELEPLEVDFFQACSKGLAGFPLEELTEEFNRILLSPAVFTALQLMVETGLLAVLMPELVRGQGVHQSFVHPDDVLVHNLRTCSLVKPQLHLRLAGLLHDVGKPDYYVEDPLVGRRFPKHSRRSAILVPAILGRFAYPPQLVERVRLLVENHMVIWVPNHGLEPIRELVDRLGAEIARDLIELVTSDRAAIWGEKVAETNRALREALALVIEGEQGELPAREGCPFKGE